MTHAIDLHIHTIPTISDAEFEFDIKTLKQYIAIMHIDVIAITNHDKFDAKQFKQIQEELINTIVFPGVEVSLEGGHMLVISPLDLIHEFESSCGDLEKRIIRQGDYITVGDFYKLFPEYKRYLLIPHYQKNPAIKEHIIQAFPKEYIVCGEVSSPKKFETMKRDVEGSLTPVMFSDQRMKKDMEHFKVGVTYVDIDTVDIPKLKIAFSDKSKVSLNPNFKDGDFVVFDDGTTAAYGLNVLLGKRSSGKTFLLDAINESFGENVKYIPQFAITKKCDKDSFQKTIDKLYENVSESYLAPLRKIISIVLEIDTQLDNKRVDDYARTLVEYAKGQSKANVFSKAKIFKESQFSNVEPKEILSLLDALEMLLNNTKYKDLINNFVDIQQLQKLFLAMVDKYREEAKGYKLRNEANDIISSVRHLLLNKAAITQPAEVDFYAIMKNRLIVSKFNKLAEALKRASSIEKLSSSFDRFSIEVSRRPFDKVSEIRNVIKLKDALSEVFSDYYNNSPYLFIKKAKLAGVPEDSLYKIIVKIDLETKNDKGEIVSGGERAEFLLLKELEEANTSDMLLFDEPEPSFDNMFIKDKIIATLKSISKRIPVIVATHNNSIGASMNPDRIIYAVSEDGNGHKLFSGTLTSNALTTVGGESLPIRTTMLDTLEAGNELYDKRRAIYENLKD